MTLGSEDVLNSDERTTLEAFVDDQRNELIETLAGLTEEQARRKLVPSRTTPLALVKHAAVVEKVWFQVGLLGRTREEIGIPYDVDESFIVTDDDTVDSVIAEFRAAIAESKAAVAPYSLDDQALHNRRSPLSLR